MATIVTISDFRRGTHVKFKPPLKLNKVANSVSRTTLNTSTFAEQVDTTQVCKTVLGLYKQLQFEPKHQTQKQRD